MARLVTLQNLRSRSRKRADMEVSQFLSDADWNVLINASADELYDILVESFREYFESTATLTVDGTVSNRVDMPADFYQLLGLGEMVGPRECPMDPFEFAERGKYQPLTGGVRTMKLTYVPARPLMSADSDTFDGINGWDEYIVLDAAIKAKEMEESDVSVLMALKGIVKARIDSLAKRRNQASPIRISDLHAGRDPWDIPRVTAMRYRLVNSQIELVEDCRGVI